MGMMKGRGAVSNVGSRYLSLQSELYAQFAATATDTQVFAERSKSIISSNRSPDVPFDQSINPYRGCEHGCIYCFARPTHAYMDLSPGQDFETKLFYKPNAAELLEEAINKPGYIVKPIALGANTDPYQPIEKTYGLSRRVLEVLARYKHPVSIITKGTLIERDIPLLAEMAADNLVSVMVSVTSLDTDLKRILEPRAASPRARLAIINELAASNIPVGALVSPIIPRINDHEMEDILAAVSRAGATRASYMFIRLPLELEQLFQEWLQEHYPDRAEHVMSLVRQSRGGKAYDSRFGKRMRGEGVFAQLLKQRFEFAVRKLGLNKRNFELNTSAFTLTERGQISLF